MDVLRSEIIGTAGVTLAAMAALLVTLFRRPKQADLEGRRRASAVLALLVLLQACHFAEEYATGFHDRFPPVLGLTPWPTDFFLLFNLTWLAVWVMSVVGVRRGRRAAFFPAWFLAIASIANGVAHPLLALQEGAYFPGLLTSPLVAVGGAFVWRRLVAITEVEDPPVTRERGIPAALDHPKQPVVTVRRLLHPIYSLSPSLDSGSANREASDIHQAGNRSRALRPPSGDVSNAIEPP